MLGGAASGECFRRYGLNEQRPASFGSSLIASVQSAILVEAEFCKPDFKFRIKEELAELWSTGSIA